MTQIGEIQTTLHRILQTCQRQRLMIGLAIQIKMPPTETILSKDPQTPISHKTDLEDPRPR